MGNKWGKEKNRMVVMKRVMDRYDEREKKACTVRRVCVCVCVCAKPRVEILPRFHERWRIGDDHTKPLARFPQWTFPITFAPGNGLS